MVCANGQTYECVRLAAGLADHDTSPLTGSATAQQTLPCRGEQLSASHWVVSECGGVDGGGSGGGWRAIVLATLEVKCFRG